jgi:ABC-type transport system substrate-binding protein
MANSYWQKTLQSRMSRRRALLGAASMGLGAAALSLLGCGGGDGAKGPKDTSGLLSTPQDTTAQAKPRGTLKHVTATDVTTLDPLTTASFSTQYFVAYYGYPRLMRFKVSKYPELPTGEMEGDLAASWELSPDKLQLTFKLRKGLKWDPRAPTSGREITAQDVAFSWKKFASVSPFKADIIYDAKAAPFNPVESLTTPDNETLVFKMKQPDSSILELFGAGSIFFVMPEESESKFDPKADVRGYGPWFLESYRRGVEFIWTKNPDYHIKGRPYPDRFEVPIITEYAQRLAQFKAGTIFTGFRDVTVDLLEMIQTKKDVPELVMYEGDIFPRDPHQFVFGYGPDSPFKDDRVRKAFSMAYDREAYTDFRWARDKFVQTGLPMEVRYNTAVSSGWDGWWVDPQSSKFKYADLFKFNVAESTKLLKAATGKDTLETTFHWMNGPEYTAKYTSVVQFQMSQLNESGFKGKSAGHAYLTDYVPNFYYAYSPTGRDKSHAGVIFALDRTYPTVVSQLFATYHPDGARFHGISPDGSNPTQGDPKVNELLQKMKAEFDMEKARIMGREFQEYVASKMYYVPSITLAKAFNLFWPVVGNANSFITYGGGAVSPGPAESWLSWWVDASKPPLNRG